MSSENVETSNVNDSLIKDGEKYVYAEKQELWNQSAKNILAENGDSTKLMSAVLIAMRQLDEGNSYNIVSSNLSTQLRDSGIESLDMTARTIILEFSKRGPEFEQFLIDQNPEKVSPLRQEKVTEILVKNAEYENNSLARGERSKVKDRAQEEDFILKNAAMKTALKSKIAEVDKQIDLYQNMDFQK